MKYFITQKQFTKSVKSCGFETFENSLIQDVNRLHQKFLFEELKKQQKRNHQRGGRVSMPIQYFGVETNTYSSDIPKYTDVSPNDVFLRPQMNVNDPSGVLTTDKAFSTLVGGRNTKSFTVTQKGHHDALKHVLQENPHLQCANKRLFVQESKQKFENLMNDVLKKASKQDNSDLRQKTFQEVLDLKKYKVYKH